MFSKTRKKIVMSIMAVLVLFLAVTLGIIYGSSYRALKEQNKEMLERYVSVYSLESLPGADMPLIPVTGEVPPLSDGALYELASFYSAAISDEGEVLAVDTGRNNLYQKSQIIEMAEQILSEHRSSGTVNHLLYRVEDRDGYTLAAFMDTTVLDDSIRSLIRNTLTGGLLSLIVMYFAACYLANMIVRPLEENDRKQKQFISDAGHELKTPVTVISANSELLARQTGNNEWLSNIQYENQRMGNLVNELLELSRAENAAFSPELTDLSKLVQQEVLPFEGIAFEQGIEIICKTEEQISVMGNRRQLGQLISILTDNAVSHGTNGKPVYVELKKEHRNAILTVRNSGDIPADVQERLFDRFYRIDESRGDSGGHFGLGLPIAKAITEAHKGKITIRSEDGIVEATVTIPAES